MVLSLEDTQLLPKGEDLEAQAATGAEEDADAADHADEEGDQGTGCMPLGNPGLRVDLLIVLPYGVLATDR